jgi:hypothetical protein
MADKMNNILVSAVNMGLWTPKKYFIFLYAWSLLEIMPLGIAYELKKSFEKLHTLLRHFENDGFDKGFNDLLEVEIGDLNRQQGIWRSFLESCAYGKPDFRFVDSVLEVFSHINLENMHFIKSDTDKWIYFPEFQYKHMMLSVVINQKGIIKPILENNLKLYERVRNCKHCNDFFFPETKKGIFCGDTCRSRFHARKRATRAG